MLSLEKFIDRVYSFEFDLEPDASSMIVRFGWTKDPEQEKDTKKCHLTGTLKIVFKTNKTCYYYYKVPLKICENFICSKSYGSFLNKHIKGKYKHYKDNKRYNIKTKKRKIK